MGKRIRQKGVAKIEAMLHRFEEYRKTPEGAHNGMVGDLIAAMTNCLYRSRKNLIRLETMGPSGHDIQGKL